MITEHLKRNAALYGEDTALVELFYIGDSLTATRRMLSWRDFDRKANRFAHLLLRRGLKKGAKIGMLMMNCLEFLPIYFGILKAGCIVVPMNYRYTADEIAYCLDLADVEVLVFGEEFIDRMDAIVDKIPRVHTLFFEGKHLPAYAEDCIALSFDCPHEDPGISVVGDDFAAIYFSSGTTGFPKAILHCHAALASACVIEQNHHSQTRDDVFLCIPPLYHTGAKIHWFGSLLSGSRAVLLRGTKPEQILHAVSEEGCTNVWLLVPWVQDILNALDSGRVRLSDYRLEQWHLMHIGAQPVPPVLIHQWKKYFPHQDYDTNYGLSESLGPGCIHLGMKNVNKVGSIGKAGHLWETRIVDDYGVDVPSGQAGELIVKGPCVMLCYYKNPEATAEALKNGWLYTGDIAKTDEDGFIFLIDRKKDIIISGGENIYPVQIENFLRTSPKVKDTAVIGLADERLGEIVAAIIELKEGVSSSEMEFNDFCQGLPRYKRPRLFFFAPIPRNPTGKIEKPLLREKYSSCIASKN